MMTLEDYLAQDARLYPDKAAAICGEETCSYSALYQRAKARAADFTDHRGKVVLFRASQTIDFLVDYFAIHIAGAIAAPLERDTPEEIFDELSSSLAACATPEGIADVLYTTGTTGRSKGVMISHRTIIADADNLIQGQGFSHNLVFIITERITCRCVLQPDSCRNVTGVNMLDIFSVVGMHLQDAAESLTLTLGRVHDRLPGLQLSGVHAEEAELSDKRVCHDLERER